MEVFLLVMIAAMLVVIGATILFLLHYIGYFYKVRVTTGPSIVSQMRIAYKFHKGNYHNCEPHFTEIFYLCPKNRTLGIFYDDPNKVGPDNCRYIVAVILAEGVNLKSENLEKLEIELEEHKFKFIDLPQVDFSVKTSHPFALSYSSTLGAKKAYPALKQYIVEEKLCAHPFIEIYNEETIHYMVPLSKQADFYVDEVRDMLRNNQD